MSYYKSDRGPSFGTRLAGSLTSSLKELAGNKVKQLQTRGGLRALLPQEQYTDEEIDQLSHAAAQNPQMMNEIAKQAMKQKQETSFMKQVQDSRQQRLGGQQQPGQLGQSQVAGQQQPGQLGQSQVAGQQQMGAQQVNQGESPLTGGLEDYIPRNREELMRLGEIAHNTNLELRKMSNAERKEAFAATAPMREEAYKKYEEARAGYDHVKTMLKLDKEGGILGAGDLEFLKGIGLDIEAIKGADTEQMGKLAESFMKNFSSTIKGAVSQGNMERYMKTFPNLMQSPEGRKRLLSDLKMMYKLDIEHYKTIKEVMKDNGYIPTLALREQVDDRMEPKRKALKKKFEEDLAVIVPQAEHWASIAAKKAAGKTLGGLASGLEKGIDVGASAATAAGIGALIGSVIPGVGTVTGTMIGGGMGATYATLGELMRYMKGE